MKKSIFIFFLLFSVFFLSQAKAENTHEFIDNRIGYKIIKSADWEFTHEDEAVLGIQKSEDDEGGTILISGIDFPYAVDTDIVEASIKKDLVFLVSIVSIVKNEDVTINGNKAKKVIMSTMGEQENYYYIPHNNYLLKIMYDYGNDDKDKAKIDSILNSISLINSNQYIEKTEYTQDNPEFSIKVNDDWAILDQNSNTNPALMSYKVDKYNFVEIKIEKTDDNTKNLNNDEYLKYIEQKIKEGNSLGIPYDIKIETIKKEAHYQLNNNLGDVIMFDNVLRSITTNEIIVQGRTYIIKAGDKYIDISLDYFNDNANNYENILNEFDKMLASFNLGLEIITNNTQEANTENNTINISQELDIENTSMYNSLKGKIMLKVEASGEAYYIHPVSKKMYYLGRPDDAFSVMRQQGIGITDANLAQIPVGLSSLTGKDSDSDGLPDLLEDAIGTNKNNSDSDGDGYSDKSEIEKGYNPKGSGKINVNNSFSNSQKGKIFLQVEKNGEAWYVNPNDSKRYFLGRPADAFQVMRNLGLGISNSNFDKL